MLKMTFTKNLDKNVLKDFIRTTDKPIVYTYGVTFRHPTTYRKPLSVDEALAVVDKEFYLDATEEENCLHLNAFSDNDMWQSHKEV